MDEADDGVEAQTVARGNRLDALLGELAPLPRRRTGLKLAFGHFHRSLLAGNGPGR